ncbi:hypothetical protein ACFYYR_04870 [Streptomyces sp. NPDC001922]|uniref:hypothetical protein n=1 Tax=Streptomyces sp. NPDC001922 TaxID=3364624 RepID=UPI0036741CCA
MHDGGGEQHRRFEAASGNGAAHTGSTEDRGAQVRTAFAGLLQIRTVMNTGAAEPHAVPAPWERHRPVQAVALALEAAGIPPSATGPDGRRTAVGYCVGEAGTPGTVRVEWLGPPGSGAAQHQQAELKRCAEVLRPLGWEALEYRGRGRQRFLEVEPLPLPT